MRGAVYIRQKQYQRAIQDFDKAIQLDPSHASVYSMRGLAYRRLGQDAKAAADRAKACSMDSKYC